MRRTMILGLVSCFVFITLLGCGDTPAEEEAPVFFGNNDDNNDPDPEGDPPNNDPNNNPGPDTPMDECDQTRLCPEPLVCQAGRCAFECQADTDCGEGQSCRNNRCVALDCQSDVDCADPLSQRCDAGVCGDNPCSLHTFQFDPQGTDYESVHIAGSFNGWPGTLADGGLEMAFLAERGLWFVKARLDDGRHEYKIVLNETDWITDPSNPETAPDGFDGQNSVVAVDCSGQVDSGICGDIDAFDWRDTVMYFLLVDRFYDSDGIADQVDGANGGDALRGPSAQYEGGDLRGIEEKLPYLRDLGVTALWLSAPYENRNNAGNAIDPGADGHLYSAYHGYWPSPDNIDFTDPDNPTPRPRVESRIGSEDDLRALIEASHASESANNHGIKVLFDYVMNHVDADSGLYQAHQDWFARRDGRFALCGPDNLWDDPYWGTRCAFTDYLPPFDFDNPDARRWSVDDALWWAKEFGIDGYRLDAIKHVPLTWLTDLRARLNQEIPDAPGGKFYLVGETFDYGNRDLLKSFIDPQTMLDGQFDFPLKRRLCDAVLSRNEPMWQLSEFMSGNDNFYGPGSLMTTWIGNHDIPRAIHFASGQIGSCFEGSHAGNGWTGDFNQPGDAVPYERLGLSFAVLMTNPGIPLIYYGDEIGMAGGGDPDNRRAMPWDESQLNAHQKALRSRVQALSNIRGQNKAISRGRREVIHADDDTWVYRMTCGQDSDVPDVVIAINRADEGRDVNIPEGAYTDLITSEGAAGGARNVGPRSFMVWRSN